MCIHIHIYTKVHTHTHPCTHTHTHTHHTFTTHTPTHVRTDRVNPITSEGQEVLLLPVGQEEDEGEVFQGLFQEDGEEREVSHL